MKNHPFSLDVISVASPCPANWDEMSGDDRVRFCATCSKHVYNLSDMTRPEAEALLQDREGPMCVQFYRRADGTVLTADCPVGLWDVRTRFARLWASAAALVGFLTFGAVTWANHSSSREGATTPQSLGVGPANTFRESLQEPMMLIKGDVCIPPPTIGPSGPAPLPSESP